MRRMEKVQPLPDVIDQRIVATEIGGRPLDHAVDPRCERNATLTQGLAMQNYVQALVQQICACLTRDDAMIRELIALRARVDELESAAVRPVDLDVSALAPSPQRWRDANGVIVYRGAAVGVADAPDAVGTDGQPLRGAVESVDHERGTASVRWHDDPTPRTAILESLVVLPDAG
jgi:hypothetical protein